MMMTCGLAAGIFVGAAALQLGAAPRVVCSGGVVCRAAEERTPDGEDALTFVVTREPKPGASAVSAGVRFNAAFNPVQDRIYRLRFWAKADRAAEVPFSCTLAHAPYTFFKGMKQTFEAGTWTRCELMWHLDSTAVTNNVYSLPFFTLGTLAKGTALTLGPMAFARVDPVRRVRGPDWRPLRLNAPAPEYFKAKRIPGYDVKKGSVLDLAQYLPRADIDAMGRIVADADGTLRFENAPGRRVRLRGFNCTYGGPWDGFAEMDDAEREYSQLLSMTASMVNTFFMLSLDWSQVGIISSMNICPTAMQIQILGILGLATGTCRSAFDRISMRHLEAGRELLEVAHKCALRVHATFKMWASQCPSLNEPLMTRARMLKHTANNLEILISRTEELPGDPPR